MQDLLTIAHRLSRRSVPLSEHIRPLFRKVFRWFLKRRYRRKAFMRAKQNGRLWYLVPEVALRGDFQEFDTILWLREVLGPGATLLDVGANVGQMSMEGALLIGESGNVLAVEPAPGNLTVLRAHLKANALIDRVEVVEGACSDNEGKAILHIVGTDADAVGSGHSLGRAIGSTSASVKWTEKEVACYTVDGLSLTRGLSPTAVKIDVEGAELSVLRGMVRTLEFDRPAIRVGFHPFAHENVLAASDELRTIFARFAYRLDAPTNGELSLEEYNAWPESI